MKTNTTGENKMISFTRKDDDKSNYNVVAQISSYGATCLRKLFNVNAKNAINSKLVTDKNEILKLLSLSCEWLSVTEECKNKVNMIDLTIPVESHKATLNFLESERLERYFNCQSPMQLDFKRFILSLRDELLSL